MGTTNLGRIVPINKGVYSASETYEQNHVVRFGTAAYWHYGLQPTTGVAPTDETVWRLVVQDGADGKSAYESAQDGGYTGTEQQFNSDLSGVGALSSDVQEIKSKIPSAASVGNKLVSASEMGDAIEAVEAKQLYKTAAQGSFVTKAELLAATVFYGADGTAATPTKNDVAYVLADESHSGKSAKYVIANEPSATVAPVWGFVITFSDSTFTQAQTDAINSGATSQKIGAYDTHVADTDIHVTSAEKTTWNGKSTVSVSATGTATDEAQYITVDGVEKKIAGGLPAVTSADNGKFLRVVNGAWAAATIENANGVSF